MRQVDGLQDQMVQLRWRILVQGGLQANNTEEKESRKSVEQQ